MFFSGTISEEFALGSASLKKYFWNLDDNYVYLDNAASTPPLAAVMNAAKEFLRSYGSIHRGAGRFSEISTDRYEDARQTVGHFIGAVHGRDVVIFTANTTDAINRAALLFPWNPGDAVLVSDIEHSSNLLPWMKMAQVITFQTDANYSIVPEAIEEKLRQHPEIRLVSIAGASNLTGQIVPVKEIYKVCQKYGKYLMIDASQLAPHYPISLDDCDLVAFSGHKMYAPFGAGVLAGRKEILRHTGLAPTGGGNVCYIHPENGPVYQDTPWRHEAGTPNGVGAVTLAAAAKVLQEIGWDRIIQHNRDVVCWVLKHLAAVPGIKLHFPVKQSVEQGLPHTPIAVFELDGIPSIEVGHLLSEQNIAVRCGTFCLYRLAERVKNITWKEREMIYKRQTDEYCDLTDRYHLIRASGGLMTTEDDFVRLAAALIQIYEEKEGDDKQCAYMSF